MHLNLPSFDIMLRDNSDGTRQVFDPLRRRWVALTPEEWVRQHFVNYIATRLGFRRALMANEVSLQLNGTARRCDTVVYTPDLEPMAIIEYKAPEIKITQRVFDQIARYNMVLGTRCLIVSNGLSHYCCMYDNGGYRFVPEIPRYDELCELYQNK